MEAQQVDRATASRMAAEERARQALIPPATLESVVTPGSLASFVGPEAWGPCQDLAREMDTTRADLAAIVAKQAEVVEAIWLKGSRRVVDVQRMAEQALKGEIPAEDPAAEMAGLAALSAQALQDLQAGLAQKEREKRDHIVWLQGRLRSSVKDLLKTVAAERIATRFGELLAEASKLHTLLDACDQIVGGGQIVPAGWREEKWLSPIPGKMDRVPGPPFSGTHCLADFSTGSGVVGAVRGWEAAVRAVTGGQADLA